MSDGFAIINARIVTRAGVLDPGCLSVRGDRIESVVRSSRIGVSGIDMVDVNRNWVMPGLIDLHVMGGFDQCTFEPDPNAVSALAHGLPQYGVTAFVPATTTFRGSTDPIRRLAAQIRDWDGAGAQPLGLLVEGPFINPRRRGGFTLDRVETPTAEKLDAILEACDGLLSVMMLAPEICLDGPYIERIAAEGVVAMGHCSPTAHEVHQAVSRGVRYATHIFNAMGPLTHREPGAAGVALVEDEVVCELICDGRHVVGDIVNLIGRAKGPHKIALVTDSLPWFGLPRGEYERWGLEIVSDGETAWQRDGTLVGTVLPLHLALKRFMEFTGWPLDKAVSSVTSTPSRVLGLENERGAIETGKRADILVLTDDFDVWGVWIAGQRVA